MFLDKRNARHIGNAHFSTVTLRIRGVHATHNAFPMPSSLCPPLAHRHFCYCGVLFFLSYNRIDQSIKGANAGIDLALAKQFVADYGCHVYLGLRDAACGANAVDEVKKFLGRDGGVKPLVIVSSFFCVKRALGEFCCADRTVI